MRLSAPPAGNDNEDSVLPLINIVFLLLIFFMIAGALSASDPFDISPVETGSKKNATQEISVLYADSKGTLHLHGETLTQDALAPAFAKIVEEGAVLQLKVDQALEATTLVDIMAIAREAGLKQIVLLTLEAEAGPPE